MKNVKDRVDDLNSSHWLFPPTITVKPVYVLVGKDKQYLIIPNSVNKVTNTLGKGMNPIILPPAMGE